MAQISWQEGIQTTAEKRKIKRMAILRVGAKAFNKNGFVQTSLSSIAAQLQVTKPSLYYYVKNKDDILTGILDEAGGQLQAIISESKVAEWSGLATLRHFFEQYAGVVTDDFGACLILMRINAPEDRFRELYHGLSQQVLTAVNTHHHSGHQRRLYGRLRFQIYGLGHAGHHERDRLLVSG